ncbi:TetR/AcrR family transcriptional regulator [Brevundimonas faecalis]|uniref:AcrR family transcriptional regulator n=1 Tax=Brevundimonas faecalis TaxID=947378 RepID=A0ABV2REL0_9CAUL
MTAAARPRALSPRKRPTQARSIALVDAILDASAQILEAEGLDALTTNLAATRAGVSIGSLYQYFPNRDAILASLMIRSEATLRSRVTTALSQTPPGDLNQGIRLVVAAAMDHHRAAPRLCAILEQEERRLGPLAKDELAGAEENMAGFVRAFLERAGRKAEDQVVRELELVGQALIAEALRTGRIGEDAERRIADVLASCAATA